MSHLDIMEPIQLLTTRDTSLDGNIILYILEQLDQLLPDGYFQFKDQLVTGLTNGREGTMVSQLIYKNVTTPFGLVCEVTHRVDEMVLSQFIDRISPLDIPFALLVVETKPRRNSGSNIQMTSLSNGQLVMVLYGVDKTRLVLEHLIDLGISLDDQID